MSDKVYIGGLGFSLSGSGGGGGGAGGVHYLGAVASASALPASPSVGDMYIASAAFTLSGAAIESGDMLIWNGSSWDVIQGNISKASSIAHGEEGFATGGQVYDYVQAQIGDIETLLAAI